MLVCKYDVSTYVGVTSHIFMHFAVDKLGQSRRLFIACHSHTYCTYF